MDINPVTIIGLRLGHNGEAVREWQKFLVKQEVPLDDSSRAGDGIFGIGTERGTTQYQLRKGLTPTGEVNSDTYAKAVEDGYIDIG